MTNNLIVHPTTRDIIDQLQKRLPQACLLSGEEGVGLFTIASQLVRTPPIVIRIATEDGGTSIPVERIRALYDETKGKSKDARYVIIDDADMMTHSAQSAFLKLLEEPHSVLHFILTSHHPEKLLQTIRSRVNIYHLPLPEEEQTSKLIDATSNNETMKRQLKFIAAKHPSLIHQYAANPELFSQETKLISDARDYLTQTDSYHRLVILLRHSSSRESALEFVGAVLRLLSYEVSRSGSVSSTIDISRHLKVHDKLSANANVRLALATLMV